MRHCPYCGADHLVSRCPEACPTCHGGQEIYVHAEESSHTHTLIVDHHEGHLPPSRVHLKAIACPICHGSGRRGQPAATEAGHR